jgi:hypothetical protein
MIKESKQDVVMEISGLLILRPHKAQEKALMDAMHLLPLKELVKYRDSLYQDANIAPLRSNVVIHNMEDDI